MIINFYFSGVFQTDPLNHKHSHEESDRGTILTIVIKMISVVIKLLYRIIYRAAPDLI